LVRQIGVGGDGKGEGDEFEKAINGILTDQGNSITLPGFSLSGVMGARIAPRGKGIWAKYNQRGARGVKSEKWEGGLF